jgi:O-antigen ligase
MEEILQKKSIVGSTYLIIALICIGLVYVSYSGIQNYSVTPRWIYFSILILLVIWLKKGLTIPLSLPIIFWFSFVLVYIISSYWSYNFWNSIVRSIPLILAPIIVMFASEMKSGPFMRSFGLLLILSLIPIVLYCFYQIIPDLMSGVHNHQKTYKYAFSFGHRNQFAHFLTLCIPLILFGFNPSDKFWRKALIIGMALTLFLLIVLLKNRSSYLVIIGLYPAAILLFLGLKSRGWFKRIFWFVFFGSIFSALIILFTPLKKSIPFVKELTETSYGSGNERVRLWSNSIDLWKQNPFLGTGSGDWKIEILKTQLVHTQAETGNVFYQRAHNDFLQILVENGLIGAIFFVLFFVSASYFILKKVIDLKTKILCISGFVAYMIISSFEFPLEKIELLTLLMVFLLPTYRISTDYFFVKGIPKFAIGVFILAILMISIKWFSFERDFFEFKSTGEIEKLQRLNKDIYTIDAFSTPVWWEMGNFEFNKNNFHSALDFFQRAKIYNPNHVHLLNNIGSSYYSMGNIDSAKIYYQKALSLNPRFVETIMNMASLNFNQRKIDPLKYIDFALAYILSVPLENEPENYKNYIRSIARAKCANIINIRNEPNFEDFLIQTMNNNNLLYVISVNARKSSRSYEYELRYYFSNNFLNDSDFENKRK